MKKEGFTLVELLAVIVVLGLILGLIIPKVMFTIANSKKDIYKSKENELIKVGEDYALYKNINMPTTMGETLEIPLVDIVNSKLINEIRDLDDNSLCTGKVTIIKTHTENYTYVPCIICTNYTTNNEYCN